MAICSIIRQQQVWQEREQLLSCFCDLFCLGVCMLGSVALALLQVSDESLS